MTDHTNEFEAEDIQNNKVISCISYLGILFFLPIVTAPQSKFGKFHANQSFGLLIVSVLLSFIGRFAQAFTFSIFRWMVAAVFGLASLGLFVVMIILMVYAGTGKAYSFPLLDKFQIFK